MFATKPPAHLREYTVVVSSGEQKQQETFQRTSTIAKQQQPTIWETSYRQVPPFRALNKHLDRRSRPWGSNGVESVIIFMMMHGVWFKSVSFCQQKPEPGR